jgi:L-alanine-DL-glutamate epimerase-like enolase superfamily enzyme
VTVEQVAIPFAPTTSTLAHVWAEELRVPLDRLMRMHGASHVSIVRVHVRDSDGASGTGFTYTLGAGASVVLAMVRDVVAPALEGVALHELPRRLDAVAASTRRLGRTVFAPALSATDMAAWDLSGHCAGAPLARLLGAHELTPVPLYGSGRGANELDDAELVAQSVRYAESGLRTVKVRIGARPHERDLARVAAVREELPDVELLVDANERLDPSTADSLVRGLQELGVGWLEEPFPAEDIDSHRELASTGVRIAAGEHLVGRSELTSWSRTGAAQVLQPDAALCGGVTTAFGTAVALPEASVAFHSLPELHVHLASAAWNARLVEHFPLLDAALAEPLPWQEGSVVAPERPGLGIRWDDDVVAASRVGSTTTTASLRTGSV